VIVSELQKALGLELEEAAKTETAELWEAAWKVAGFAQEKAALEQRRH
jgi:hypothetical protein